jgi:hypothetical protein
MNDSRVQGRTDFKPTVTTRLVIQPFQLMRMLVDGPCQFQGHLSWVSVEQRPTTYGRYSRLHDRLPLPQVFDFLQLSECG